MFSSHNQKVYADLLKDLFDQKEGMASFSFTLAKGQIVDYIAIETKTYHNIGDEAKSAPVPTDLRPRDPTDRIWPNSSDSDAG